MRSELFERTIELTLDGAIGRLPLPAGKSTAVVL
jgi:hypothetical protein